MGRHLTIQSLLPVVFVSGCGTNQPAADNVFSDGHRRTAKQSIPTISLPCGTLENGLPIQEWDQAGLRRFLVELDTDLRVAPDLFALPAEFRPCSMETESSDDA